MKAIALTAAAVLGLAVVGCDRTVSHQERTSENPITGTTTHKQETVKERPDGSVYKETSKSTNSNTDRRD
jgi:hypothetical protein